jgi:hypothetical protein
MRWRTRNTRLDKAMDTFQKRTALRIALVSFVLASLASPVAWMVTREAAEESVVALANEESGRLLHRFNSIDLSGPDAAQHAKQAAYAIAGGLFDIAEIYDAKGIKLAESLTAEGDAVESLLPQHGAPRYLQASYESLKPSGGLWLLRVFVPLRQSAADPASAITGYFEGVRVIPQWQQDQIFNNSLTMASPRHNTAPCPTSSPPTLHRRRRCPGPGQRIYDSSIAHLRRPCSALWPATPPWPRAGLLPAGAHPHRHRVAHGLTPTARA